MAVPLGRARLFTPRRPWNLTQSKRLKAKAGYTAVKFGPMDRILLPATLLGGIAITFGGLWYGFKATRSIWRSFVRSHHETVAQLENEELRHKLNEFIKPGDMPMEQWTGDQHKERYSFAASHLAAKGPLFMN